MVKEFSLKRDGNIQLSPNFQVKEFKCKDGTDKILINTDLITVLESLREYLDNKYGIRSIRVNSGYRTPAYNKKIGGSKSSQHMKGNASDITVKTKLFTTLHAKYVCIALQELKHNKGIGYINSTGVHVDVRSNKMWFDESKNNRLVSDWYGYFNIPKPKPPVPVKKYVVITAKGGVWSRKGVGFKYPKYQVIPYNTKCELLERNKGIANDYAWDKVIYNNNRVCIPNKWCKYI